MKHTKNLLGRWGALLLSLLLVVSVLAGCGDASSSQEESSTVSSQMEESSSEVSQTSSEQSETSALKPEFRTADEESTSSETGSQDAEATEITVKVIHGDGSEKEFPISTTAENLGDALVEEGLVEGEESSYGLFITTVDGETADDSNQEWWCLTKGGEMWNYGADSTEISDGDTFELTLTVGY